MTGPGEVFGTCYHGDVAGIGRKLWLEAGHGLWRHSRRRWLWWWEQADKLALSEMTRSSKPNLHQHNQVFNHFLSAQTLWEGVTAGGTEQASLPFFTSACWTRVFVSVRCRKTWKQDCAICWLTCDWACVLSLHTSVFANLEVKVKLPLITNLQHKSNNIFFSAVFSSDCQNTCALLYSPHASVI